VSPARVIFREVCPIRRWNKPAKPTRNIWNRSSVLAVKEVLAVEKVQGLVSEM